LQVIPQVAFKAGSARFPLANEPPAVSFDVRLAPGSALSIALTGGRSALVLSRGGGSTPTATGLGGRSVSLPPRAGWREAGGWRHVEISGGDAAIDGQPFSLGRSTGYAALSLHELRGHATVSALIISPLWDRGALLFHRLAELHARAPDSHFPTGASRTDRIYYDPGWTSGFYAGALWEAAALEPAGGMFARWALSETVEHFGMERAPTHDVGFMYGQSSLRAWQALCGRGRRGGSKTLCARLRASVVSAAGELMSLAATNPVAGTIPTSPTSAEAETIVDSMMNIAILPWATAVTGDRAYRRLALHQATVVARVLVRENGSTAQSANFDRATGRLISVTTHQGLSNTSTWARGEGWAVYGFAVAASELRSRTFLRVAERAAGYVSSHLAAGGVPRWDYDAPAGAPVDVSAGVITAAGLLHLTAACRQLDGPSACAAPDARWTALAERMLAAALGGYASPRPPLGLLSSQIEDQRWGGGCWCNHGELVYGLSYALEGLNLLHAK
jgi:unsaturated chondroitin disaccharide hydrolase